MAKKKKTTRKKAAKTKPTKKSTKKRAKKASKPAAVTQSAPSSPKSSSDLSKMLALAALVLVVVLLALSQRNASTDMPDLVVDDEASVVAEQNGAFSDGDLVSVRYVGRFTDGEIFDTNDPVAAEADGFPIRSDQPFAFALGQGAVVPGFEKAVRSLEVGQKETFTIPAEEAYGAPDESLITQVPRVQTADRLQVIERVQKIPAQAFTQIFGDAPVVGKIFMTEVMPWDFEVMAANEQEVTLRSLHTQGQVVRVPGSAWDAVVVSFDEDIVTLRADPDTSEPVETPFGVATITADDTTISVSVEPTVGAQVPTQQGVGTVVSFDDVNMNVDLNHPLAGKDLVFEIELLEVKSAQ